MKLNFDEAMQAIDEQCLYSNQVKASALRRKVWIAEWHLPGCLSESRAVCLTKKDAIESALSMADSPRGMKTSLQKYGRFDCKTDLYGYVINTVTQCRFGDLF